MNIFFTTHTSIFTVFYKFITFFFDFNKTREADAKIRVVVRKRPLSKKEKAREDVDIVDMNEDNHVYLHEPRVKVDMTRYVETHEFAFDNAFDEKQNNSNIYEVTCRYV